MAEFLVIVACLYQQGCNDTATYYYSQNQELQAFTKNADRTLRERMPESFMTLMAPVLLYGSGQAGVISVSKNLNFKLSRTYSGLIYQKEF